MARDVGVPPAITECKRLKPFYCGRDAHVPVWMLVIGIKRGYNKLNILSCKCK